MYYNIYVLLVFLFAVLIKVNSNLLANKFCYDVVCCVVFHFILFRSIVVVFISFFCLLACLLLYYIVFFKICYFISLFKKKTHMAHKQWQWKWWYECATGFHMGWIFKDSQFAVKSLWFWALFCGLNDITILRLNTIIKQ